MNFIKKIVDNQVDEAAHNKLARYGKGEYDRGLLIIKKGKNLRIKGSFDWANDLFGMIAEKISENVEVSGKIIAPRDFESELEGIELVEFKKRGQLYTATLKTELTPEQMKALYEKYNVNFILLSLKTKDYKLKVKDKLPKPGGKVKDNFCTATLPLEFLDEFCFDCKYDFKEVKIINKFLITEIIVPDEYADDALMARKMAKRKGTLKRIFESDDEHVEERDYAIEV